MFDPNGYQVFLFDFDGLLVNTEPLHYRAYQELLRELGEELPWDFRTYCTYAHSGSSELKNALYVHFPHLGAWEPLYERKCQLYSELLEEIELMPGVAEFLEAIGDKKRAVVTHSRLEHIDRIRRQHPILQTIPNWITREDYSKPKPDPECYQKAIRDLAAPHEQVVGFEDTPRGIAALEGTRAQPVIVCADDYPLLKEALKGRALHLPSFGVLHGV